MNAPLRTKHRMTVDGFLAWSEQQPEGERYELIDGEPVAMAPERVRHNLVKMAVARALQDAVSNAGLPCTVFTDGVGVRINEHATREPDASVQCGKAVDAEAMLVEPVIVVEVVSASSERQDTGAKLVDYFSVAGIEHYLIVLPKQRAIVHHRRGEHAEIATYVVYDGEIELAPPGITVAVAALLGPELPSLEA